MRRLMALLFAALLVLAACSPNDESVSTEESPDAEASADSADGSGSDDSAEAAAAGPRSSGPASDFATTNPEGRPTITIAADAPAAPTDVVSEDVVVGEGATVEVGDLIEVNYVGVTLSDGTEFDASWDRGQTFFVPIGVGNLITGWDQGLIGMTEGTRRLLVVPPEQAYGQAGAGGVIGPNESLVFVVDLLQVVPSEPPDIPDITEAGISLASIDVTVGDGELVEAGDTITVNYQGNLLDGTIFDSSWQRGQPFSTVIGIGQVIPGWDQGMVGMREGGRRILVIPSELAYGEAGAGALIGPNAPLVFVVDLLRVQG